MIEIRNKINDDDYIELTDGFSKKNFVVKVSVLVEAIKKSLSDAKPSKGKAKK